MPRWRRGYCGRGRMPKPLFIGFSPSIQRFVPFPRKSLEIVELDPSELEALRLVDFEGLTQEEAGKKMGVSRGTVWRLLESGRKKIVDALVNGKEIVIGHAGKV